ncbi:replicative DNA helicase (plasmid) [Streptomyces sp. NBC_00289]|uniref:replicative DNA helicase n=1 Tax=Streptomyces sp. NBC_00289 TaxID=2975703 RepID=UPI002F9186C9
MTTVPSSRRPGENPAGETAPASAPTRAAYDVAAERSALGAAILSKDAIGDISEALEPLKGAAFYLPVHETIWNTITAMYAKGDEVTSISLGHQLKKDGELARVGGDVYLSQLIEACPSTTLSVHDAEIVLDRAKLRRLQQTGTEIAQMAAAGEGDADEILDDASKALAQVTQATTSAGTGYTAMDDLFPDIIDEIQAIEHGSTEQGIPTGFTDLDNLTNGFLPGQMIVVAARPAMGKSTLAVDFVRAASIKHRLSSAVFSLEMSKSELGMRILSAEARVGLHHLRGGTTTAEDWKRIARVSDQIRTAPMVISDEQVNTLTQIKALCRRIQQNRGLDLVVIDYIQLLESGNRRAESRQQEVSDISRSIKLLAKELQVPVIALSQLNRGPEQRTDKKPLVSDLRESGSIEQDADMVILLHREDAYEKETPRAGEADLIVAKHRNGPTATVTVAFQGHYSRFVDMAQT